jgi:aryl-alcohol dehydrogenase-like predicted oxidoreductase
LDQPTKRDDLEFATIPETSLRISPVGLGTWAIGGWMRGGMDDVESVSTIHAATERGVYLIDTARAYGFRGSEEIVGRKVADAKRRLRVVIATKPDAGGRTARSSAMQRDRIMRGYQLVALPTPRSLAETD